jgi:hypothetical protein
MAARRPRRPAQRAERDALALQYRERQESKRRGQCADPQRFTKVHPELWSAADVLYWLKSIGLADLTELFACNDLEGTTLISVSGERAWRFDSFVADPAPARPNSIRTDPTRPDPTRAPPAHCPCCCCS